MREYGAPPSRTREASRIVPAPPPGDLGQRLPACFRLKEAASVSTRSLKNAEISVTDCCCEQPDGEISSGLPEDDAYIVGLQLRDYPACESWEGGKLVARSDVRVGETHIYDIKRDPRFVQDKPFRMLGFYIPRAAFVAIAEEAHAPRVGELGYRPGTGWNDEVVKNLGRSMLSALDRPEQANRIFVDHVTIAIAAHVARAYGGWTAAPRPLRGGLAGWQQRRACALLDEHLDGSLPLRDLAAECGLSTGHFARAFRQSLGMPPHAWLLKRRVEVAQALMRDRRRSLSEIAVMAGFADQSHFARVFSKSVGVSPRAWRRELDQRS
jgi:AraC family transcriptional regulator